MLLHTVVLALAIITASQLIAAKPTEDQTCMGGGLSRATPEVKMAAKGFVDKAIRDNKVMVFSKSYCPYCRKAKSALNSVVSSDKFTVVELDHRSDGDSLQDYLLELTGGRSVPRVFVDGQFIGGGDDTARLAASGELKTLLAQKGIL